MFGFRHKEADFDRLVVFAKTVRDRLTLHHAIGSFCLGLSFCALMWLPPNDAGCVLSIADWRQLADFAGVSLGERAPFVAIIALCAR